MLQRFLNEDTEAVDRITAKVDASAVGGVKFIIQPESGKELLLSGIRLWVKSTSTSINTFGGLSPSNGILFQVERHGDDADSDADDAVTQALFDGQAFKVGDDYLKFGKVTMDTSATNKIWTIELSLSDPVIISEPKSQVLVAHLRDNLSTLGGLEILADLKTFQYQ